MKWHKFDPHFWTSETAHILKEKFGARGLIVWLRLISSIAKDIHSWSDVQYAYENGWKKSLREWASECGSSSRSVKSLLTHMAESKKLTIEVSESGMYTLRFKNFAEFVHKDALSSKSRGKAGRHNTGKMAGQLAGQEELSWRAPDNIDSTPAAMPPPEGGGGHSHATQTTKKNSEGHIANGRPLSRKEKKEFVEDQRRIADEKKVPEYSEGIPEHKRLRAQAMGDFLRKREAEKKLLSAESDGMASGPPTDPLTEVRAGKGNLV